MGQPPSDDDEPIILIEGFDPETPTPRPAVVMPGGSRPSTLERIRLQEELDRSAAQAVHQRLTELEDRVREIEGDRQLFVRAISQWKRFRRYLVAWIDLDRTVPADAEAHRRQWRAFRKFVVTWLRERD